MKNKILVGLTLLVTSIGGFYNPLNGMTTRKLEKIITINESPYRMTTETARIKYTNGSSIEGATVIRTLQSVFAGCIEYSIRHAKIGDAKKKVGHIYFLKTAERFRHWGIGERLALEAGKFFFKNNVTDITFSAMPFESDDKTKNADMKRLVDYYLRLGKKYRIHMSHDEINTRETKMQAIMPNRSAPVHPRPTMIHSRPMIPSRL